GKSGDDEDYAMYEEETPLHIDIRRFTYAELKLITNNFQSIIGKGGFGIVYHGTLENGDEVAVKVLMETSIAESTDFLPEVKTQNQLGHNITFFNRNFFSETGSFYYRHPLHHTRCIQPQLFQRFLQVIQK
uniref:Serine-threonine/tyrosine-protein kinase catalytic domain-containing protein n=1 Tax=Aegilops tauschii subsp. strangulata TaxID=200361 RepID=A0A453FRN7_AEGTS